MFSSIFSTSPPVDPNAPNFHPVATKFAASELFGELEPKDTEWLCAGGFVTETQTFYTIGEDGTLLWCQVIHSAVGVWYPTIQFTCKIFNPKTGESIWKSINVSNFVTPPPNLDKRSSKADEFSITYKSAPGTDFPESYTIRANLGVDLQISLDVSRPATIPGYKIGKGPEGGYSYFGHDVKKADGYVIHRFWPRFKASGHIIKNGKADTISGPGMFVHAIQGMRPNLVASSWNFAYFQSEQLGGVSAIQMEFKTLDTYKKNGAGPGGVIVNIGSLVVGNKLASVTAEARTPGEPLAAGVVSRATPLHPVHDPDTSYNKPSEILFEWKGPSLLPEAPGDVSAKLEVDLGDVANPKGLIEKVDILAEIPYVIKMAVNYVAGTKPYMYQWINPATLELTGPEALTPELSSGVKIEGTIYNEATFISA
ncbi:survival factor 1 [Crucibulum laeve]|uniref:Survival factor 1 n=1 Tax=Crucibulum laeve TaxID=68775 RepID=A0A5C3M6W1_9AGAR|nr:survival factor 1 [Crucibulum laeve]